MEGLAQANAVLTSSISIVMAQLAQITMTMNDMQAQLKTFTFAPTTNQVRKGSTTAGFLGAISLTGTKPAHPRKRYTNITHTTINEWAEVKRYVNGG